MRYIAIKDGFCKSRIRKGETFNGPDGLKGKWFMPATEKAEAPQKALKAQKAEGAKEELV